MDTLDDGDLGDRHLTPNDPSERSFDTYEEYRDCLNALLANADREIILFDSDLRDCRLNTEVGVELLRAFFDRNPLAPCLRILVKDASFIERYSPRLLKLLADFGHRIRVRVTAREHRTIEHAFAVFDHRHVLIRFHAAKPRGKLSLHDTRLASQYNLHFESIWDRAQGGPNGLPIGL